MAEDPEVEIKFKDYFMSPLGTIKCVLCILVRTVFLTWRESHFILTNLLFFLH